MRTQLYDKADEYNTLYYTNNSYKQDTCEETLHDMCNTFFVFETITSGTTHMPYLCWIYNDDIQQECVGMNTCAVDRLNTLPTGKEMIFY